MGNVLDGSYDMERKNMFALANVYSKEQCQELLGEVLLQRRMQRQQLAIRGRYPQASFDCLRVGAKASGMCCNDSSSPGRIRPNKRCFIHADAEYTPACIFMHF